MTVRRKSPSGLGVSLILLGLIGILGDLRPANAMEAAAFYGFGSGSIVLGICFLIQRGIIRALRLS